MKKFFFYWYKALRLFSLTVALVPIFFGTILAWQKGKFDILLFILVTLSGLLLQAGTNLINDYFEFKTKLSTTNSKITFAKRDIIEKAIFISGLLCLIAVIPIGLYFIKIRGTVILFLGIIGLLGSYGYTGQPLVYKELGLGPLLVFFLMGNLMVFGSYYIQTNSFSWLPWISSIPISLLTSLLLISNEIRDIKSDKQKNIKTMSVRLGLQKSITIFQSILLITYISQILLIVSNFLSLTTLLTLLLIPWAIKLNRLVTAKQNDRKKLVIQTANFNFAFGLALTIGEYITQKL